jgi:hypothetical protein
MLALLSRLKACGTCKTAVIYNNAEAKRARLELLEPLQPWTGDGDPPTAQNRNAVSNVDKCMTTAIQLVSGVSQEWCMPGGHCQYQVDSCAVSASYRNSACSVGPS